ncbi:MAG TPA: hypothetical protein VJ600_00545 [Holophagaceae bacterium]|nr:hypothetical protein [Holophagaceae bacterium]
MRPLKAMVPLALLLAALPATPGDTAKLFSAARSAWPDSTHFAVVCDYNNSREAVQELAANANGFQLLTIVDVRRPEDIGKAMSTAIARGPAFLMLLPKDPVVRDGSFAATQMISSLDGYHIPTVGTKTVALDQGAYFVLGDETNNEPVSRKGTVTLEEARPAFRGGPRIEVITVH